MQKLFLTMALVVFTAVFSVTGAYADKNILGSWMTKENKSKVEIRKCGDKLCGKIVWLKEPNKKDGTPKTDGNNPDKKLQQRKIIGLELLTGFVKGDDKNTWEDGKIYNPEDGEIYSCTITLQDDGKLNVRGYVGISLFGKSQIWTRAK